LHGWSEPHARADGGRGALQRSSDGAILPRQPAPGDQRFRCATLAPFMHEPDPLSDWPLAERARIHGVLTDIDDTLTTDGASRPRRWPRCRPCAPPACRCSPSPAGRRAGASRSRWPGRWTPSWPRTARWRSGGAPTDAGKAYAAGRRHPRRQLRTAAAVAQRVLAEMPTPGCHRQRGPRNRHRHRPQRVRAPDDADIARVVALMRARRPERHRQLDPHQRLDRRPRQAGGARWIVRERLGRALDAELDRWVYVGDSTNDAACSATSRTAWAWPTSRASGPQLSHRPRYVAGRTRRRFCRGGAAVLAARTARSGRMSEHPLSPAPAFRGNTGMACRPTARAAGAVAIFGSTFFELVGYFMLTPWLLLRLKDDGRVDRAGRLFAASGWVGIFLMTPFRLGHHAAAGPAAHAVAVGAGAGAGHLRLRATHRRRCRCGSAEAARGHGVGPALGAGRGGGGRVSPPGQRGRNVGLFETMVGATFVIGPAAAGLVGPQSRPRCGSCVGLDGRGPGLEPAGFPALPPADDAHEAAVGWRGVWHALRAHPVIIMAGFVGGFFESGLTSILPLYGLALGLGAAGGGAAGVGQRPGQRADDAAGRPAGRPLAHHPRPASGATTASPAAADAALRRHHAGIATLAAGCPGWRAALAGLAGGRSSGAARAAACTRWR
jgi:hypothetical protein